MARYRGGDGYYADMECAYAELERYLVLSCDEHARLKRTKATNFGGLTRSCSALSITTKRASY